MNLSPVETTASLLPLLALAIPLSLFLRLPIAPFSPPIQASLRHKFLHLLWLAASLAVIALLLRLPPLRKSAPGYKPNTAQTSHAPTSAKTAP